MSLRSFRLSGITEALQRLGSWSRFYVSTRMFWLKNGPVPVPHGHKTARKVGGVTGSIGGPLSINNVIIGC